MLPVDRGNPDSARIWRKEVISCSVVPVNVLTDSIAWGEVKDEIAMKAIAFTVAVLLGLAVCQSSAQIASGPFGFERGMTFAQLSSILGDNALEKTSKPYIWRTASAPKPHPSFEDYLLVISPTDGLLKVMASGVTIETSDSGREIHQAFDEIVAGISRKYGTPTVVDSCNGGVGCSGDPGMWMLGLLQKNRTLAAYWQPSVNSVTGIFVEATALSLNKAWVSAAFEFGGFSAFLNSVKAKQDTSY